MAVSVVVFDIGETSGVHIRRGPWGHLHEPPPKAIRIRSLDELPEVLP